jgi:hypothetical protein
MIELSHDKEMVGEAGYYVQRPGSWHGARLIGQTCHVMAEYLL